MNNELQIFGFDCWLVSLFSDTCKYDVPTEKCDAVDFNLLNQGAV